MHIWYFFIAIYHVSSNMNCVDEHEHFLVITVSRDDAALNSSPPGQNGRHFADNIFICIFVNKTFCILSKISLKFVPNGPIDNNPALVQIMAWCRIGHKPLSEPMLTQFIDAYICSTRERWVDMRPCLQFIRTCHQQSWLRLGLLPAPCFLIRCLIVRSHKVSKPWDMYLEVSDQSEIWQALQQHSCQCSCRIS